ncbi:MAG: PIN domain-containing protein [Steroidobacteraceae bacterium]
MDQLFLDANVLFTAAHNPEGKAAFLFVEAARKRWNLLCSDFAIEEARRNIALKYPDCLDRLEHLLRLLKRVPQPASTAPSIELPEKDQPIYVAAQASGATHLLTGDIKHFGPHMNRPEHSAGIFIQTVADYLARL